MGASTCNIDSELRKLAVITDSLIILLLRLWKAVSAVLSISILLNHGSVSIMVLQYQRILEPTHDVNSLIPGALITLPVSLVHWLS